MDPNSLSSSQRQALDQLQVITNGGDAEVAISVLDSVSWDVQRAADIIFDQNPSAPLSISRPSETTTTHVENFDIDDSEQGLLGNEPGARGFRRTNLYPSSPLLIVARPLRFILAILAFPFHILRTLFRLLRIPLPQLPLTLSGLTLYYRAPSAPRPELKTDPRSAAERWVRSLEEETGAICLSRVRSRSGDGASTGVGPSSSSLTSRPAKQGEAAADDCDGILPDFFVGSYEEFARTCAKETDARIGCVILVSEEHDDVPEFKSTLTDPTFVRLMQDNNFLVWGGDIRDRDAWSASQKLQATTYPFVAFVALQPRRSPSSRAGTTQATLTILSRHQGPSIPAASAPTSAKTLVSHLNDQLLPRVQPFLTRIRAQAVERENLKALESAQREHERAIRAEQDRAFAESQRKDKDRIEARIAEDRRVAEEARRREEAERIEREEAERLQKEKEQWETKRMIWRRWGRRTLLPREPRPTLAEPARGKTIRIGVRMPDGRRGVRFFGEGDSLTAVYAFVDTLFIPDGKEFSSDSDPAVPPEGAPSGEEGLVKAMYDAGRVGEDWWGFKLVLSYPRRDIIWETGKRIADVEGLKAGGQLVIEMVDVGAKAKAKGKAKDIGESKAGQQDEDDGYVTEESD
ncbi:unnamed protein product [Somion occarium]|uniref:UBX domain-containing protein n=1 Tax=Somion occarium TaxID=3059160 RepID=A0ABP1DS57_9APHY